jgi:lipoprotein-releasing system permease protein
LNLSHFISKRIRDAKSASFTATVIKIAIGSVAIGLAVMIISFAILEGFRETIQTKVFSLGAHLQITKYSAANLYEEEPVSTSSGIYENAQRINGVAHIQQYSLKPALLKTETEVQGVVLKGVGKDFNIAMFDQNMVEGSFISLADTVSDQVVISKSIATLLKLNINDSFWLYFLQSPPRFRKLKVQGIYETGLEEFDEKIILGDIRLIKELNQWDDSLAGGFEVFIHNFDSIDEVTDRVYEEMEEHDLQVEKITDQHPQLFDWLVLLSRNVNVFLILILTVACFNMVSTLLIMIMERTNMIGLFKALGATNWQIRKIFMYNGMRLILQGLFFGNLIGLGFCFVQYYFRIIPLDTENYYMSFVPIHWNLLIILILNLLTFVMTTFVLLIPTVIITRIKPIKAIKFD